MMSFQKPGLCVANRFAQARWTFLACCLYEEGQYHCYQGRTLNKGRGQDHVSTDVTYCFWLTGDAFNGSEMQCNPIIVDGVLYATTPKLKVIALNAATGQLKWSFDPNEGNRALGKMRNRGVTYWADGNDQRIYFGFWHWLFAIEAVSGKPVMSFGEGGKIDLREGLGRPLQGLSLSNTTPGVVYKDLLIVGFLTSEALPSAPGDIRVRAQPGCHVPCGSPTGRTGRPTWRSRLRRGCGSRT